MTSAHLDSFVRDRLPAPQAQPEFLFTLPELQYPEKLNAAVELMRNDPQALAVINDAGSWSYGDIDGLSDRIARLLVEEEGLVPGNRVFLRGPNGAMLFAAWLGVLKAGGIVVATMPILRTGEIATVLDRARIHHAIVDDRYLSDFLPAAEETGLIRSLLTYGGDAGSGELERRLARIAPGFPPVTTGRDDVALIAFTSGTTGKPKGCVHYHRDILACADSFARHILRPESSTRWLCSAPIAFTFGLGMQLIFPWRFGGAAVTVEQPGPKPLLEAVARHQVTNLATAPTAYKAMLGLVQQNSSPAQAGAHSPAQLDPGLRRGTEASAITPNLHRGSSPAQAGAHSPAQLDPGLRRGTEAPATMPDISSLRTCVSAGEHLPAATWHAWHEATGLRIVDGIGATEMMHIFISASGEDIRPGATGKAVPGYVAAVLDDAGTALETGTGRLAVKGPTGCRYFDDDRQADYVQKGWNVTGDTYRKDGDGYFWFVARSDDMIISSGYNIAAPEVENALYAHPAVQECAVIGVPCPERGQRVKAFVVLAPGHAPDARILQDHVKATIAPFKYPRDVEFVEALPKTATGKLQRYALREPA